MRKAASEEERELAGRLYSDFSRWVEVTVGRRECCGQSWVGMYAVGGYFIAKKKIVFFSICNFVVYYLVIIII